jgi:NADH-quinone oxidoreductase subunit H
MPESETDLVAGFNTEYGAFKFGLFFVGEYTHIIIGSGVFTRSSSAAGMRGSSLDSSGRYPGAIISASSSLSRSLSSSSFFIWIRWTLPRFRYDQVMTLGWNKLLPLSIANLIFYAILIALIDSILRTAMATIKVVERKPLSFAERTYLPQIVSGLKITMKNMLKPPVTLGVPR